MRVRDPLIIEDLLSAATRTADTDLKFTGSLRIPAVRPRMVVRAEGGSIARRIIRDGRLRRDLVDLVG